MLTEVLLGIIGCLCLVNIILLVLVYRATRGSNGSEIKSLLSQMEFQIDKGEKGLRDEISRSREESSNNFRLERDEITRSLSSLAESHLKYMTEAGGLQNRNLELLNAQLARLSLGNEEKLERMRQTIEAKLDTLQKDNNSKLEQMRSTVDEKLQSTLEVRLGESFRLVSERLEMVHKGLGEMQALAAGVGDLKKVLSNVKTRGIWGEIQLGNILEQVLTSEQYESNVCTKKGSSARVEFAIRLPGQGDQGEFVWLPIDAKFPQEDYLRLVNACELGDPTAADEAAKQLENRIRSEAKDICEKYLDPPNTTDFAIMFLPTEGLYAEVARRAGLTEEIQRIYRVSITGPNTMSAFLNSLSMGFHTLAIEKRSSEVWKLLRAVKTEFGKFGDALDKTHKKIQEAGSSIEKAATRSRQIERKLKEVQNLPLNEAQEVIGDATDPDE